MSRDRGNRAAAWVASYLTAWWPSAERTPNGRSGADLENTPGVAFEIKTGATWRNEWLEQVAKYAVLRCQCGPGDACGHTPELPVLVYLPPGLGEKSVHLAQAVMPFNALMEVLEQAGYAPGKAGM